MNVRDEPSKFLLLTSGLVKEEKIIERIRERGKMKELEMGKGINFQQWIERELKRWEYTG